MAISKIIVVGAGPAGLVLSLLLAKAGIHVQILEAAEKLDEAPRATHYSSPSIYELGRAGVLDDIRKEGFMPNGVTWRKLDGSPLASLSSEPVSFEQRMVCLPLNKVTKIILDHITQEPNVQIKWSHKVTPDIGQDGDKAWVNVETPTGKEKFEADYIVGCDGASSQIRRALFGDWEFPGRTWEEQIVATNVYYDMEPYNWSDANFIIDPEHWSMVSQIQPDGLLRVTYGDIPGLTREEYIARQPMKFQQFLPGRPTADKYKIVSISPYKIHQRCAETLKQGRFLLAADAAHLCNPFGGLGLTGGLVDCGNLFDCFNGIHLGLADATILDRYDEVRRKIYRDVIDPISSENIRRLWQDPEKAAQEDTFLEIVNRAAVDPELSRKLQTGLNAMMYDFRQEYEQQSNSEACNEPETTTKVPVASSVVVVGEM